jgi:hypothetical protein
MLNRTVRHLALTVLAIVSATALTTLGATSASAVPDSGGGCVNGPNNNSYTCFYVTGHGLYIDSLTVQTCVKGYGIVVHDEITGPAGNKLDLPQNSPAYPLLNDCLPAMGILVNGSLKETPGEYCGVGWHDASTGTYLLSRRCVDVHS